jgi:hypothetical protein
VDILEDGHMKVASMLERFLRRSRGRGSAPDLSDVAAASRDMLALLEQFRRTANKPRPGEGCLGRGGRVCGLGAIGSKQVCAVGRAPAAGGWAGCPGQLGDAPGACWKMRRDVSPGSTHSCLTPYNSVWLLLGCVVQAALARTLLRWRAL